MCSGAGGHRCYKNALPPSFHEHLQSHPDSRSLLASQPLNIHLCCSDSDACLLVSAEMKFGLIHGSLKSGPI